MINESDSDVQIDDIPVEQSSPSDGTTHWEWTHNNDSWRITLTHGDNNLKAHRSDTMDSWAFVEWVLPYDSCRPALTVDAADTKAAITEFVRWTVSGPWPLGNRSDDPQPGRQPAPPTDQGRE